MIYLIYFVYIFNTSIPYTCSPSVSVGESLDVVKSVIA